MLQAIDLVFPEDLVKLPRKLIEEACLSADIPADGPSIGLAENILNVLQSEEESVRLRVFDLIKDRVFASRRGITWHKLPEETRDFDIVAAFSEHLGIEPFTSVISRDPDRLNGISKVMAACPFGEGRRYLVRLMVKIRVQRVYVGQAFVNRAVGGIISAIVDLDNGLLEIRDDPKYSTRILGEFTQLFSGIATGAIISPRVTEFLEPYGGRVEGLADELGGRLISADTKPELDLEDLTGEQIEAVSNVLEGISNYFETPDLQILENILNESKIALSDFGDIPFLAILLTGMEKLGLSVHDVADVRTQPLINVLKPHLQYQGGFIKFPVNENGVTEYHTIRVGLQSNSVSFRTFATENAIDKVRRAMIR